MKFKVIFWKQSFGNILFYFFQFIFALLITFFQILTIVRETDTY